MPPERVYMKGIEYGRLVAYPLIATVMVLLTGILFVRRKDILRKE